MYLNHLFNSNYNFGGVLLYLRTALRQLTGEMMSALKTITLNWLNNVGFTRNIPLFYILVCLIQNSLQIHFLIKYYSKILNSKKLIPIQLG